MHLKVDGVFTAPEIQKLLQTSKQLPEPRYRIGFVWYVNESQKEGPGGEYEDLYVPDGAPSGVANPEGTERTDGTNGTNATNGNEREEKDELEGL